MKNSYFLFILGMTMNNFITERFGGFFYIVYWEDEEWKPVKMAFNWLQGRREQKHQANTTISYSQNSIQDTVLKNLTNKAST